MLRWFSTLFLACLAAGAVASPAVAAADDARVVAIGGFDADVGELWAGSDEARRSGLWQDIDAVGRGSMIAHLRATPAKPRQSSASLRETVRRFTEVRHITRSGTRTVNAPKPKRQPLIGLVILGLGVVGVMLFFTYKPRTETAEKSKADRRYMPPGRPALRRQPVAVRPTIPATGLRRFAR
ncbi:hypothetical protein ACFOMD_17215 [Sphingoaurantiacus capsulatus]|uniref:Uncharacterized protein n=1 Tax=Sphingoaurantiacus capsulatus TaxID=1771310 RepID=A0ABV7XDS2_9SPHN